MPRPQPIQNHDHIINSDHAHSVIGRPTHFGNGSVISQHEWNGAPRPQHTTIINNTTVINNVTIINNDNRERDHRRYWHDYYDGSSHHQYCHYYDDWGYHWYGWYIGSDYFWSRYYADRWWVYDRYYHRWNYYNNGSWWYQDPYNVTVVYIYVDNSYYRYEESRGGVVTRPDTTPPVEAPADPAPAPVKQATFYSVDGTRMVQVFGDNEDAFLYDTAETPAFDPTYLGSNVKDVQYSDTENGEALQILILMEKTVDGKPVKSFKTFDADGKGFGAGPQPGGEPAVKDSLKVEDLKAIDKTW